MVVGILFYCAGAAAAACAFLLARYSHAFMRSYGGDPARVYDRFVRRTLLLQRIEEVLSPRELNLVRGYLGIGQPNEHA